MLSRFNPLSLGSMVVTQINQNNWWITLQVSIPFPSGPWSLHAIDQYNGSAQASFNPLSLGAMVVTAQSPASEAQRLRFQSPFPRGHGRYRGIPYPDSTAMAFQSPFPRGHGRYTSTRNSIRGERHKFQSLDCTQFTGPLTKGCSRQHCKGFRTQRVTGSRGLSVGAFHYRPHQ